MSQPPQKPYRSKQDYATPGNFIAAVKLRLGIHNFGFDFAADAFNAKAAGFWTAHDDSLSKSASEWARQIGSHWGWLNPPFTNIGPWAAHCNAAMQHGAKIALLVPASVGANWYRDYVHGKALVLALNGRLAFMPDRPTWWYPKDCILCLYSPDLEPGFEVWDWRKTLKARAA